METLKSMKEEDLLQKVVIGDELAFNELYERYHKLVFFVANKTCRNEADAQDILQETFLTIKDHVKDLRDPKYFRLWVYRIISSKCKNMFKKNMRIVTMSNEDYFNNTLKDERRDRIPQSILHFQSDKEVLESILNELPEPQRIVLVMFYMDQFSILEIAHSLQIPEGTVKSRLSTARKFIEVRVKAYEHTEQISLNFHSFGEAITACLLACYASLQLPSFVVPAFLMSSPKKFWSSIQSSIASHWVTTAVLASVVTLSTGGAIYANLYQNDNSQPNVHNAFRTSKNDEISNFTQVSVNDEVIKNAKDGFYVLQLEACCKKDIDDMSVETLISLKNLYLEMKTNGGEYYQHLVENGWAQAYERKIGI